MKKERNTLYNQVHIVPIMHKHATIRRIKLNTLNAFKCKLGLYMNLSISFSLCISYISFYPSYDRAGNMNDHIFLYLYTDMFNYKYSFE